MTTRFGGSGTVKHGFLSDKESASIYSKALKKGMWTLKTTSNKCLTIFQQSTLEFYIILSLRVTPLIYPKDKGGNWQLTPQNVCSDINVKN